MAKEHLVVAEYTKNRMSPNRVKVYTAWRLTSLKFVTKSIMIPFGENEASVNFYLDDDTGSLDKGFLDLVYFEFNVFDNVPAGHKIYIRSWEKNQSGVYESNDEDSILTADILEGD